MIKQEGYFNKPAVTLFLTFILLLPIVFAATLQEGFASLKQVLGSQKGMEAITGKDAVTVSISVGNNPPNISHVSLAGETFTPVTGWIRFIEVSFLADDPEGSANLDNNSAQVNVSYQSLTHGYLTVINNTCSTGHSYIPTGDLINYTCIIEMPYYYDHSTEWQVDVEINDSNNNKFSNASEISNTTNWTYTELVAFNLSAAALTWGAVAPSTTNQTDTSSEVTENTGNSLSLNIRNTIIDLGGATSQATYIPAGNFTVGYETTGTTECDYLYQTASTTPGVLPLVGVNNTQIFPLTNAIRRGQGYSNNLYYCLFHAPDDLTSQTYSTTAGGSWDITALDSGE